MTMETHPPDDIHACPDPRHAYEELLKLSARDTQICTHRDAAVGDMTSRTEQTGDLQKSYEEANTAQKAALRELLEKLKAIRKTIECQVDEDYARELSNCFCDALGESDETKEPAAPEVTCEWAEEADTESDLERLQVEAAKVIRWIAWLQARLDELTGLPATIGPTVTELAAEVAALDQAICDKSIEDPRAYVVHLHLRHRYVSLRRQLTDSRTYMCAIYERLDQLFGYYELDICLAGAIARLRKKFELADEKKAKAKARLVDDVLICARTETCPPSPPDDLDDVESLDPCPPDCDPEGEESTSAADEG